MRQQAAKTRMIHARIEPKLQESAARVFSRIGISTTEAIRLFCEDRLEVTGRRVHVRLGAGQAGEVPDRRVDLLP